MRTRIAVSSRKGLFFFDRMADGWRLTGDAFLGSPVTLTLHDRRDGMLYAALNLGHFGPKLHRSGDGGRSWSEVAAPAFAAQDAHGEADAAGPSVCQIWAFAEAGDGGLWAGTIPGGLFHSSDRGESWTLNQGLWEQRKDRVGGGYDDPGIHSICVDPRNSRRLAVAVSTGGVWLSEDGGETWTLRTTGMRAEYVPPELEYGGVMQDAHRMVQCRADPEVYWVQHHNGIFRSADDLASWTELSPAVVPAFGFAVAVHPHDPDTAWFVPAIKDEYRYPKDGKFVVSRTRDGGRSFEVLDSGLPTETSYDLVYRHGLDVDEAGEYLVMGSTTGGAWVSEDAGDHWTTLPARLPPIYAVSFI